MKPRGWVVRAACVLSAALVVSIGQFPGIGRADRAEMCQNIDPQTVRCRISRPAVASRMTEYRAVAFEAGDAVRVIAGGCVNMGSAGLSWRRYVNPVGTDASRFYAGTMWIPGATSGLVRVAGLIGKQFSIPSGIDPAQMFLRLGYEDDNYSDNNYANHDNGQQDQCKGVGPAWVGVLIRHDTPASPTEPLPFDLVTEAFDRNWMFEDPLWGAQQIDPGAIPNPQVLCDGWPYLGDGQITYGDPPCTGQYPAIDYADNFSWLVCSFGGQDGKLHGHVNWALATMNGTISWSGNSLPPPFGDFDYSLELVPPDLNLLTPQNGGSLHIEFNAAETINHFQTPWWVTFRDAVYNEGDPAGMINGKDVIATGLVGQDSEHGAFTEIHPVTGLAIHVNGAPDDDMWAMFARNSGNEGYCSQDIHYFDFLGGTYNVFLPWYPGATSGSVGPATVFRDKNGIAYSPSITFEQGQGVLVSFPLLSPESRPVINGELHIDWSFAG